MKENPPYSHAEIRLLLAQYLDGGLEPDRMAELDLLIEREPEWRDELLKMQALRGMVHTAAQAPPEPPMESPSEALWQSISKTLQTDASAELLPAEPEFISAYYDGEIPSQDPAFIAFERQLYHNGEASRLLGDIGQVSEAVRQFGYRLESNCTLDITEQVMAAYLQEQGLAPQVSDEALVPAADPAIEMLSAYADQELSPRETIEANRLIEQDERARQTLSVFSRLSARIQSVSVQLQAQAPDCWPMIRETLETEARTAEVVPLHQRVLKKNAAWVAIPAVAAAALLVLAAPGLLPGSDPLLSPSQHLSMGTPSAGQPELASVPLDGQGLVRTSNLAGPDVGPAMDAFGPSMDPAAAPAEIRTAPRMAVLEPDPQGERRLGSRTAPAAGRAPSSEEYLFQALNEQMPGEDIEAILGQ